MDNDAPDALRDRQSDIFAKVNETRQRLARTAESIAHTAEQSADMHAALADSAPDAGEHAARDRRLAAAERASAAALRRGELPPEAARRVIRAGGRVPDEQADPRASAAAFELDSSGTGPADRE